MLIQGVPVERAECRVNDSVQCANAIANCPQVNHPKDTNLNKTESTGTPQIAIAQSIRASTGLMRVETIGLQGIAQTLRFP